jgi:hypothetical protein
VVSWLYKGSEILPLPTDSCKILVSNILCSSGSRLFHASAFQVQSLAVPHWINLQSTSGSSRSVIWYYGLTETTKRARAWCDWPNCGVIVLFTPAKVPILEPSFWEIIPLSSFLLNIMGEQSSLRF